jgi:deoxycytidine triphosphate deaminase
MSVIPFISNPGDPNISICITREENRKNPNLILILNADETQLKNDGNDGNGSYDLRVGDKYLIPNKSGSIELRPTEKIKIPPNSYATIESLEEFKFPSTRFGHIFPKVTLMFDGLSNTTSKIDPGYEGNLMITTFNLGRKPVELTYGQKFCSLIVHSVADGSIPYGKKAKKLPGYNRLENKFNQVINFFELNNGIIMLLLTFALVLLTLFLILK